MWIYIVSRLFSSGQPYCDRSFFVTSRVILEIKNMSLAIINSFCYYFNMISKSNEELIRFIVREEVEQIVQKKIKHLPSSELFLSEMDKLHTKLDRIESDRTVEASWKDDIEKNKSDIKLLASHVGYPLSP